MDVAVVLVASGRAECAGDRRIRGRRRDVRRRAFVTVEEHVVLDTLELKGHRSSNGEIDGRRRERTPARIAL